MHTGPMNSVGHPAPLLDEGPLETEPTCQKMGLGSSLNQPVSSSWPAFSGTDNYLW